MNQFFCSVCSTMHPLITLFEFPLPTIISDISSGKIQQSLNYVEKNMLVVNRERMFILCDLSLNIIGYEDDLDLLVWVEITKEEYQKKLTAIKNDELFLEGKLVHLIPFYEISGNKQVTVYMNYQRFRFIKRIIKFSFESELKEDFQNGISQKKLLTTLEKLYHLEEI